MEPVKLDYTANIEDYITECEFILRTIRPDWDVDNDVTLKAMSGGYINILVKCHHQPSDEVILIRINGGWTGAYIDRERELAFRHHLHKYGLCQPIFCIFNNGVAYGYNDGIALDQDLWDDPLIDNLTALLLARLHTLPLSESMRNEEHPLSSDIDMWMEQIPDDFQSSEKWHGFYSEVRMTKAELTNEWQELAEIAIQYGGEFVCCHTDAWMKNIIYSSKKGECYFIDFEFSGKGYRAYDVAIFFQNWRVIGRILTNFGYKNNQKDWINTYLKHVKRFRGLPPDVSEQEVDDFSLSVDIFMAVSFFHRAIFLLSVTVQGRLDVDFNSALFKEYWCLKAEVKKKMMVKSDETR